MRHAGQSKLDSVQLSSRFTQLCRVLRLATALMLAMSLVSSSAYAQETGWMEICKDQCGDHKPLTGNFAFTVIDPNNPFWLGFPVYVPVGSPGHPVCSPAFQVGAGNVDIYEGSWFNNYSGLGVSKITAVGFNHPLDPVDRLVSYNLPNKSAKVQVVAGDISNETVVTYTNCQYGTGQLKICKVAGPGIDVNTPFDFYLNIYDGNFWGWGNAIKVTVPAGPAPSGYCVVAGAWNVGSRVDISEDTKGAVVSNINVAPPDRLNNKSGGYANITIDRGTTEVTYTNIDAQACSGQSLITLDPLNNVAYAPIYARDGNNNSQIQLVSLNGAMTKITNLSLAGPVGSVRAIATSYDPKNKKILAEALLKDGTIGVYVIDTTSQKVDPGSPIVANGLKYSPQEFGGILQDPVHKRAFVAGREEIGILDTSNIPPVWNPASVVTTNGTDSIALNQNTQGVGAGTLFVSDDSFNQVIDTTAPTLFPKTFEVYHYNWTDGIAFDSTTSVGLLSDEHSLDETWGINMATLNTGGSTATADHTQVSGLGFVDFPGLNFEGPGGQVAVNCSKHQAAVVDESGPNLKLVQLPSAMVAPGALNNRGGCNMPLEDPLTSVYTIAATLIPQGDVNGTKVTLRALGDPNSLTMDATNNVAYMLADDIHNQGYWGSTGPMFLVRVDLGNPKPPRGAGPTGGCNGVGGTWTPSGVTATFRLQ